MKKKINVSAMQCAHKKMDEYLDALNGTFHRLGRRVIHEELFHVISGFEALRIKEK